MRTPQFLFAASKEASRLPLLLRWPWLLTLLVGLALGLLAPQRSQAQAPGNDLCASAAPLTAATTCTPIAGTLDGATADASFDAYYDVWYSFTATGTENHVVVGGTAGGNLVTVVYGTCPNSSTPVVSYNSSSTNHYLTGLTPGQPYKVRVYDITNTVHTGGSGNFTICLTKPFTPTPANDLCSSPQAIVPAMPCTSTNGTVGGALADPNLDEKNDVWYSFVATSSQHHITVTATGGATLTTEVYTSTCPNSASTPLFHNAPLATGLTTGATYLVRVFDYYSDSGFLSPAAGAFTICIDNLSTAPANDECATAIGLGTINSTCTATSGTVYGATQSGVGGGAGTADDDVWYSFVATNARAGVYLTNTGGLDLVVDLRTSPCATTSNIRYGDQAGGTAGTVDSVSVHNLVVGTTYFVRVFSFGSTPATAANGTFTLCVTTPGVCAPPTALNVSNITNTGAQLNWAAGAAGVQYRVEYGPTGFTPGTGTVVTTAFATTTITGLSQATAYQFYVTQTCASTVSSVRVGPQAFSTTGLTTLTVNAPGTNVPTGTYDNVVVTPTGVAIITGTLTVNVAMTVQPGGILVSNCQQIVGAGTFTLGSGAELRICDPSGIYATGNTGPIRVTGTRSFSTDGLYTYNGTISQSSGSGLPGTVRELTLNNPAGLVLTNTGVDITRVLRLTSGNFNTNVLPVRLLSNVNGTALVDNTGGVITGGPVQVERYVNNTLNLGLGYRHFSAPVQGADVNQLATSGSSIVTNPAYNLATAAVKPTITPYPTVFSYDQNQVPLGNTAADFDQGWQSPASNAATLNTMRGYTTQVSGGQTATFSGPPNNGAQAVTGLGRSGGAQSGWHLLGNPYPSPIDWSTMTTGFASTDNLLNVSGAVYVFQTTGRYAGTYRSYQNGMGGGNPIIASGQGFFVRKTGLGSNGIVRLFNSNRITTWSATNSTLYRTANDPRTHLVLALASPGAPADQATVYFENGATPGPDARFDATKLRNPGAANIFSLAGADELDINGLPLLTNAQVVVPLGYAVVAPGPCIFSVAALANLPATTGVWLRDAQTGTLTDLRRQPAYAFVATAGSLSSSSRFALVFGPAGVLAAASQLNAAQVALFPNPAHREVTLQLPAMPTAKAVMAQLFNGLGQSVLVRELPLTATGLTARFDLSAVPVGVYSLRLTAAGTAPVTKRLTIE